MNCSNCGSTLEDGVRFCKFCGTAQEMDIQSKSPDQDNGLTGYSAKINDPAFAQYLKKSKRWALIFSSVLALVAIIGFFIYGETSSKWIIPRHCS